MEIMRCVKFIRCPIWLHSMLSNANLLENYWLVTWPTGGHAANVKSLVGSLLWIHLMIHDSLSFKISIFIRQYLNNKSVSVPLHKWYLS